MRGLRTGTALAVVAAIVLASATATNAAGSNAAAYRAQVNAICRSYTTKFKSIESDMTAAKRAGDNQRYAYELGIMLGLAFREGLQVEHAPVPADARKQMAAPLRVLHSVDVQLRRTLAAAVAGDGQGFATEAVKLTKLGAPLNHLFDAAGLRDCGSNQS